MVMTAGKPETSFLRYIRYLSLTQRRPIVHWRTHTRPLNGPLSRTTRVSRYQKGKPIWIILKQETVSGSGISWAICKSAHRSRQTTTPAPHQTPQLLQAGCPSCRPTNSVKALKAAQSTGVFRCQRLPQLDRQKHFFIT